MQNDNRINFDIISLIISEGSLFWLVVGQVGLLNVWFCLNEQKNFKNWR